MNKKAYYILLFGLAVTGMSIVNYATNIWGAGLFDRDTYHYVSSAWNLANGQGYVIGSVEGRVEPLLHFPPMLPTVLAGFELFGVRATAGVRYLNIVLFGMSAVIFAEIIRRGTNSKWAAVLGGTLFISSNTLSTLHFWALSEPLYLFLTLAGFWMGLRYFDSYSRRELILSAVFLSAAFLTRLVGLSGIAVISLMILVYGKLDKKKKWIDLAILNLIGIGPMVWWTLNRYLISGTISNREFGWAPLTLKNYLNLFYTHYKWYLPDRMVVGYEKEHFFLLFGGLALIVYLIMRHGKNQHDDLWYGFKNPNLAVALMALFMPVYLFMIVGSKVLLDPAIGMSDRILFGDLVGSLFLVVTFMHFVWSKRNRIGRGLVIGIAAALLIVWGRQSYAWMSLVHNKGLGIGREFFHTSETIIGLKDAFADGEIIYANNNQVVFLHTGETAYSIRDFQAETLQNDAVIFLFTFFRKSEEPMGFVVEHESRLELLAEDRVGELYIFRVDK